MRDDESSDRSGFGARHLPRILAFALVAVGALLLLTRAQANVPVLLDPTFGNGGTVTVDIGGPGPYEDEHFGIVEQPDGKLIAPGKAYNIATGNFDFVIIRYNHDGSLDSSFGDGGKVLIDFVHGHDEGLSLALQPDSKIVIVGRASWPDGRVDFGMARVNPDGSRDTSFGWGGLVMTDFFGGRDTALSVVVQPDTKIVVGGFATRSGTGSDFALVRYNANGSRDTSFGWGGFVTTDWFGSTDAIMHLVRQPDGKLVANGMTYNTRTRNYDFAVARYNANGSRDATFGWGGVAALDISGGNDISFTSLVLPSGKILVGGLGDNPANGSPDATLVRYNANGSVDNTFATYGKPGVVTTDFFGGYDQILSLAIQPDGKILAAGHAVNPVTSFEFALSRYLPDGNLDLSFGTQGRVTTDFFGGPDGIHGIVLHDDGTGTVAGDTYNPSTGGDDFALARYLLVDPSWIEGVVAGFPATAFVDGEATRAALLAALQQIDADIAASTTSVALTDLQGLRTHLDGCPSAPDTGDWIVDCPTQLRLRTLVDQLINKLS